MLCSTQSNARGATAPKIQLAHGQFLVDGRPFPIRGIHYGPWRPGTGPNKQYPYPSRSDIAADFAMIQRAHANAVMIVDPPADVLDVAAQYNLKVVYTFTINWWTIGGPEQQAMREQLIARAAGVRTKPALLAYMLGNEVGGEVLKARGDVPIVNGLRDLYTVLKTADPEHPISHANWPPARHLALGFLDFISFNVYPLWPPEVVATGYERYVDTVLRPIAADKPLVISEFGANTIEAGAEGQGRLIRESWDALNKAGAAGGFVFEFADEWWKNYDNPARDGDWWTRVPASDDERRHDADPEENYGLVEADRTPKPAFAIVATMFGEPDQRKLARSAGTIALVTLMLIASGLWLYARRRHARRHPPSRDALAAFETERARYGWP